MRKCRNLKVQPLKLTKLSEEERKLRVLGLQLGEVIQQIVALEHSLKSFAGHLRNLKKETTRLGKIVEQLQKQAELKRIEKKINKDL